MDIDIYCDETRHLQNEPGPMGLGCVWLPRDAKPRVKCSLREAKAAHGIPLLQELKWGKVSPSNLATYAQVIDTFLADADIHFRSVLIPDKGVLDHKEFEQTPDDWYYKMSFVMLKYLLERRQTGDSYRVFLDLKDKYSHRKAKKLHRVLCNHLHDFDQKCVVEVQPVRSHETEYMPLCDVLLGAVVYKERALLTNSAKLSLIEQLERSTGQAINQTTGDDEKFNVLRWRASAARQ